MKGRRPNGDGCVYYTVNKVKRKKILEEECSVCKNCTDRTACNNRIGYDKCVNCKNCKDECLIYCDRFYCNPYHVAQISVNGKQKTAGNGKKQKEAVEKKKKKESQVIEGTYVNKSNITIAQLATDLQDEKLKDGTINENTHNRHLDVINGIEESDIGKLPIQKINEIQIKNYLNSKKNMSQSEIKKHYDMLCQSYEKAVKDKIIPKDKDIMEDIKIPTSNMNKKLAEVFEVDEQVKLIKYINTHEDNLVSRKSQYDNKTIKNLILIGLMTGARDGEMGALDYTKHIDFKLKKTIIERTLTRDKNKKIIMGTKTKTGNKKRQQNKVDEHTIPFNLFDEELIKKIYKEQIEVAKSNTKNNENLLFCRKDGRYICSSSITNIFKRICRAAKIKPELVTGCYIHMTRHTFVTRLIERGMPLHVIIKFTGHTTTKQIEETYGHILDRFVQEEIAKTKKNETKSVKDLRKCFRVIKTA